MKQPELGKKIVELRKEKGYTQEELVEKCNLNVRTLQRIESGIVTPRAHTIKIIFEALSYNFFESPEKTTNYTIRVYIEILYNYILGLVNLKKLTLNKILFIVIIILSIIIISLSTHSSNNQKTIAKARQHIENSNVNIMKWYSANQLDSIETQYLNNANLIVDKIFPHVLDPLSTINNPKNIYRLFKLSETKTIKKKSKKMIINNKIAVDIGILTVKSDSISGKRGTYFSIWYKTGNSWKIETEIFNLK